MLSSVARHPRVRGHRACIRVAPRVRSGGARFTWSEDGTVERQQAEDRERASFAVFRVVAGGSSLGEAWSPPPKAPRERKEGVAWNHGK